MAASHRASGRRLPRSVLAALNVGGIVLILLSLVQLTDLFTGQAQAADAPASNQRGAAGNVNQAYGAFTTAVTVEVPQYYGLEPALQLSYASSRGNGLVGVGWNLDATSYIQRAAPAPALPGGAPTYTAADQFLLDGEPLVADTSLGGTHSTRYQRYLRITHASNPDRWIVVQPNGVTLTYAGLYYTGQGILQWALTEVADAVGHRVYYGYWCDPGYECYLDTITYSGTVVRFYRELRPDPVSYASGVHLAVQRYRLKTIDVTVGGQRARAYGLFYGASAASLRSVLTAVQHVGRDATLASDGTITGGTAMPVMRFTDQAEPPAFTTSATAVNTGVHITNGGGAIANYTTVQGDFNGDGRTDLATISQAGQGGWSQWIAMELAGDSGFVSTTWNATAPTHMRNGGGTPADYMVIPGDYNGDGKTDLAVISPRGQGGWGEWIAIELSTGAGFISATWSATTPIHMRNGVATSTYQVFPGDFNGDGKTDLATLSADAIGGWGQWIAVELSTGAGFTSGTWSAATPVHMRNGGSAKQYLVLPGDYNGDGKTDLATLSQEGQGGWGQWIAVELSTGSGFASQTWASATPGHMRNGGGSAADYTVVPGDYNGDGKTDLATLSQSRPGVWSTSIVVDLSVGSGFNTLAWATDLPVHLHYGGGAPKDYTIIPGDFNGDGRSDLAAARIAAPTVGNGWRDWSAVAESSGNGFTSRLLGWNGDIYSEGANNPAEYRFLGGDYAGQGTTSLMLRKAWNTTINASGSAPSSLAVVTGIRGNGSSIQLRMLIDDAWQWRSINLEGVTVSGGWETGGSAKWLRRVVGNGSQVDFYLSDGIVVSLNLSGAIASGDVNASSAHYMAISGSGASMYFGFDTSSTPQAINFQPLAATNVTYYRIHNAASFPDLLTRIDNGLGGSTSISYLPSSRWSSANLRGGVSFPTAHTVTVADGRGGGGSTSYAYAGAAWDWGAQRFLGFQRTVVTLDSAGTTSETIFHQSSASQPGQPAEVILRAPDGGVYQRTVSTYSESAAPPYTSLLVEQLVEEYNLTATPCQIKTSYTYDQYGNRTGVIFHGDVAVSGDERTVTRGYAINTSTYLLDKVAWQATYSGTSASGTALEYTEYRYDNLPNTADPPTQGLLTKERRWNDQTTQAHVTSYTYDQYGNVLTHTDASGHTTTYEYDPTYHVFQTAQINALGQRETQGWDSVLGRVTSHTDANGQTITTSYDALGRMIERTLPNGGFEHTAYLDWGSPTTQRTRITRNDGSPDGLWEEHYTDGLGREWKVAHENGATREVEYSDTTNQIGRETLWYTDPAARQWISHTYDGLGRRTATTYPDGATISSSYGVGTQIDRDALGHVVERHINADGHTTSVREWNGSSAYDTTMVYDTLGRLVAYQDASGNQWHFTWDSLGRRLSLDDPDLGPSSYAYDAAGQLTAITDAKGQTVTTAFDALNRPLTRTYPNGDTVQWAYDAANVANGIGRLASVSFPGGTLHITGYSATGQPLGEQRTIDALSATMGMTYDAMDRLQKLTYPDGASVAYHYDNGGRIASIDGYVDAFTYDAAGHLLSASYANGTIQTWSYDAQREWLSATSVTNGAATLFNAQYTYDLDARVQSISSATNPLLDLDFTYDDLDRLTQVAGGQQQSFTYDAVGNITSNSLLGAYTYGDPEHPHAVTAVGAASYTYDANGNMLTGAGRTITWDAENRPLSISTNGTTTTFGYDHTGQRIKKTVGSAATYYIGRYAEHSADGWTNYIYAGDRLVAQRTPSSVQWMHADHLNSTRLMTDQGGQIVQRADYRAYGAALDVSGPASTSRMFGGHIYDASADLVWMQSRAYDPALGRFLTPDSIVPGDETNPQALNRYAYAFNNPISNVDPDGHAPFSFNGGGVDLGAMLASTLSLGDFGWSNSFDLFGGSALSFASNFHFSTFSTTLLSTSSYGLMAGGAGVKIGAPKQTAKDDLFRSADASRFCCVAFSAEELAAGTLLGETGRVLRVVPNGKNGPIIYNISGLTTGNGKPSYGHLFRIAVAPSYGFSVSDAATREIQNDLARLRAAGYNTMPDNVYVKGHSLGSWEALALGVAGVSNNIIAFGVPDGALALIASMPAAERQAFQQRANVQIIVGVNDVITGVWQRNNGVGTVSNYPSLIHPDNGWTIRIVDTGGAWNPDTAHSRVNFTRVAPETCFGCPRVR